MIDLFYHTNQKVGIERSRLDSSLMGVTLRPPTEIILSFPTKSRTKDGNFSNKLIRILEVIIFFN